MKVKGIRTNNTTFVFECNQIIQIKDKVILITDMDSITLDLKYNELAVIL